MKDSQIINQNSDIFEYLNQNIWVRLSPTANGVGVTAIRDIPKGIRITDYDEDFINNKMLSMKYFLIESDEFASNLHKLHPSIQDLMKDRYIYEASGRVCVVSPNCHQFIRMYINHNQNPNVNSSMISIKNIKAGEEITFSYCDIISEKTHEISKKHYANIVFANEKNPNNHICE